jgi:hypothetical protein
MPASSSDSKVRWIFNSSSHSVHIASFEQEAKARMSAKKQDMFFIQVVIEIQ